MRLLLLFLDSQKNENCKGVYWLLVVNMKNDAPFKKNPECYNYCLFCPLIPQFLFENCIKYSIKSRILYLIFTMQHNVTLIDQDSVWFGCLKWVFQVLLLQWWSTIPPVTYMHKKIGLMVQGKLWILMYFCML